MRYRTPISVIISILLLAIIVALVGPREIASSFKKIGFRAFFLACGVFAASLLCHTLRWSRFINATKYHARFRSLFQYLLIDKFANAFLPTAVLGIAARSWLLNKEYKVPTPTGLASIVLDYGIDIFGTFLLAAPCYLFLVDELPRSLQRTFQSSLLFIGIAGVAVFLISSSELFIEGSHYGERIEQRTHPRLYRITHSRFAEKFVEFSRNFGLLLGRPRITFETFLLTFAKVILDAVRVTILFSAFDITVPIYYFILFDSAWVFFAPLMFTPGGVGVVESGRIALYSLLPSVSPSIAAPVVFIDRIISYYLMVLIGGAVFFYRGTGEMMDLDAAHH